jgi:hypothetical protein
MQDFPVQVVLTKGLAVAEESEGLVSCINLRASGKGLQSVLAPRMLYPLTGVSWPFPQVFRLGGETYVCLVDSILHLTGGALVPVLQDLPNAGYPWGAAEVGGFKIFTNNKIVVTGLDTLAIDTEHNIPPGLDVCAFSGQFVIAAPWAYGKWNDEAVAWSRVGSPDFTIGRDNVAAIRYAQCGVVSKILPFKKKTLSGLHFGFAAFGSEGVTTFLTAARPAVFSQLLAHEVGIHSSLAAAGGLSESFFVDSNYNLCHLTDGEVKVLGYQQFLKGVAGAIVLSYDALNRELWVSY